MFVFVYSSAHHQTFSHLALNIKSVAKQVWFYFLRNRNRGTYAAGIRGNYNESSDCFEYPKSHLNQATQKILAPKNPEIKNFKPPKILPSTLSLEIRSTPQPPPPLPLGRT